MVFLVKNMINQIKEYLEKYKITSKEMLEKHIEELSRNTTVDKDLVFMLVSVLDDEELLSNLFSREKENNKQEINRINDLIGAYNFKLPVSGCIEVEQKFNTSSTENKEIKTTSFGDFVITTIPVKTSKKDREKLRDLREKMLTNNSVGLDFVDVLEVLQADSYEELEDILAKKLKNSAEKTKKQEIVDCSYTKCGQKDCIRCYPNSAQKEIKKEETVNRLVEEELERQEQQIFKDWNSNNTGGILKNADILSGTLNLLGVKEIGKKESQTVKKAPVFTYCKQMKNAIEALSLRSLYGHERYEKGDDWENFARVDNGEFEYGNAEFRHALEIGHDEDEKQHLIAGAWNAVARLELYLRKNK